MANSFSIWPTSDDRARLTQCHLTIPKLSLTLVADRENCVSGIWQDPNSLSLHAGRRDEERNSHNEVLSMSRTLFGAELPISIVHLRQGSPLPEWRYPDEIPENIPQGAGLSVVRPTGADSRILGFGEDGSIYQFTLLTEDAWNLLCFVQELASRSPEMSLPGLPARRYDVGTDETSTHTRHVDGDILARALEMGPGFMRRLFEGRLGRDQSRGFLGSADVAHQKMEALLDRAYNRQGRDAVSGLIEYLTALLRPRM